MEGAVWRMDAAADGTWRRVGKMRERRGRFSAACYHESTGAVFAGGISGLDVKYLGRHLYNIAHCHLAIWLGGACLISVFTSLRDE